MSWRDDTFLRSPIYEEWDEDEVASEGGGGGREAGEGRMGGWKGWLTVGMMVDARSGTTARIERSAEGRGRCASNLWASHWAISSSACI